METRTARRARAHRWASPKRALPSVARERGGSYRVGAGADRIAGQLSMATLGAGPDASPALAEFLALTEQAAAIDRRRVALAAELRATGEAEERTGVGLDLWQAAVGRACRGDAITLDRCVTVLAHMPQLRRAFQTGVVSFSQLRGCARALHHLAPEVLGRVDDALLELLDEQREWLPDELVSRVERLADACRPDVRERADAQAMAGRFLLIQPDLFGARGRLYGEYDTPSLEVVQDTLDQIAAQLDTAPLPGPTRALLGQRPSGDADTHARRNADALLALCTGLDPDTDEPDGDVRTGRGTRPAWRPKLLLTMSWDALCGRDGTPAELVTAFTGGRLKLSAKRARQLLDEGFDVRTIVLDDTGDVLGVGRQAYRPPSWLRDALTVLYPTSVAPLSRTARVRCDDDHHTPWTDGGTTDLHNLAPLSRTDHRLKDRDGWTITDAGAGARRWTHARSGLAITVPPATRRPRALALTELPRRRTRPQPRRTDRPPPPTDPPDG